MQLKRYICCSFSWTKTRKVWLSSCVNICSQSKLFFLFLFLEFIVSASSSTIIFHVSIISSWEWKCPAVCLCFIVILPLQIETVFLFPKMLEGFCKMSISDPADRPIGGSRISIFFKLTVFATLENKWQDDSLHKQRWRLLLHSQHRPALNLNASGYIYFHLSLTPLRCSLTAPSFAVREDAST